MFEVKETFTTKTQEVIAQAIRLEVKKTRLHPYDINCGQCTELAEKVLDRLAKQGIVVEYTETENMDVPNVKHDYPGHAWLVWKPKKTTLHFDAEEPEGIRDWKDLPIFHRYRANIGRKIA